MTLIFRERSVSDKISVFRSDHPNNHCCLSLTVMFVLQGASDPECLQQDRRHTEAAQRQAHPRPQVAVRLVSTLHGQYSLTRSTARPCVAFMNGAVHKLR